MKVKMKQISTGTQPVNQFIKTDGNGGVSYSRNSIPYGKIFPTLPIGGDLFFYTIDNKLYNYDELRLKWLSVEKYSFNMESASINRNNSVYLNTGSSVHSSTNGILLPFNGTIIGASLCNLVKPTKARVFEIRVNNSTTNRVSLTLLNTVSVYDNTFNLNFNAGDIIQGYTAANAGVTLTNIIMNFYVACRQ